MGGLDRVWWLQSRTVMMWLAHASCAPTVVAAQAARVEISGVAGVGLPSAEVRWVSDGLGAPVLKLGPQLGLESQLGRGSIRSRCHDLLVTMGPHPPRLVGWGR